MATHTIRYRRYDDPGAIVWNDETGEVAGDHGDVPAVRLWLDVAERDGHLLGEEGRVNLRDPRHDPADFLAVLVWSIRGFYERLELPPALAAVKPTPMFQRLPAGVVS